LGAPKLGVPKVCQLSTLAPKGWCPQSLGVPKGWAPMGWGPQRVSGPVYETKLIIAVFCFLRFKFVLFSLKKQFFLHIQYDP
jgi:hypothetical protein